MKNNALVSIIMSTYNEELGWIKESINSILGQTYCNFEFIIVLDNPENKQLKQLLEDYATQDKRIYLIINKGNIGLVNSLNIALKHCSGKYIARMDADDISDKKRLELQINYLEKNNLDFVFSGIKVINENDIFLYNTDDSSLSEKQVEKSIEIVNITNHPTWFLKTEIYTNLEGYREIPYCEDYDFALRCISKKYKIGKMDQNIIKYRIRKNGVSRTYSLEQFLNSKEINKLYKIGKLENFEYTKNRLNIIKADIKEGDKNSYLKADENFYSAVNSIKKGRIIVGVFEIFKSFIFSKHYRKKNLDTIIYKFWIILSTITTTNADNKI